MKKTILFFSVLTYCILLLSACGHTHEYGEWVTVKEPTCVSVGMQEQECPCGEKQTQEIPPVGHVDGEWVVVLEPTCTDTGKKNLVCSVCGDTITEEPIPQIAHVNGEWTVAKQSTCMEAGEKVQHCTVCNNIVSKEIIPAEGHSNGKWTEVKQSSCKEKGLRRLLCEKCGEVLKEEEIPLSAHKYDKWETDKKATCTAAGKQHSTCSICGHTEEKVISAAGHTAGKTITDKNATCTANGSKHTVCSVCGATISTSSIPATGHRWVAATCSTPKKCSVCGATEGNALGHNYVNGSCTRCDELEGIWWVGYYVDEFLLPTNNKFLGAPAYGIFNNLATNLSDLEVDFRFDKISGFLDVKLVLYEYGWSLVKNTSSNDVYYDVKMRLGDGSILTFEGVMYAERGNCIHLENEYVPYLISELKKSGHIVCLYIENRDHPSTNYTIYIESSNFGKLIGEFDQ